MSYNLDNFTEFVNRESQALTATLFMGGDSAKVAMYMGGVKGKTEVPKMAGTATLQKGTCKTPSGETVVSTTTIEVEPWTFFESFCEDDLQNKFPNMVLAKGSSNSDTPQGWQETIVELKVASINETLELTYWQGDTAGTYNLFDGWLKRIDAATGVIAGNTSGATEINKTNVISLVDDMYVAAPAKVKRAGNLSINVGDDVFDLYIAALKAANLYHYSAEHEDGTLKIGGNRGILQRQYGLNGTDRMIAVGGQHLIIGADVIDEGQVMKIWYSEDDDKVYFRSKAKSGVTIDNPEEIVEFTLSV